MTTLERSEAAEYYWKYIDQVPPGDTREVLERQLAETSVLLDGISEAQSSTGMRPGSGASARCSAT